MSKLWVIALLWRVLRVNFPIDHNSKFAILHSKVACYLVKIVATSLPHHAQITTAFPHEFLCPQNNKYNCKT